MRLYVFVAVAAMLPINLAAHADSVNFGSYVGTSSTGLANGQTTYTNATGSGSVIENQYRTYATPFSGTEWVSYTTQVAPVITTSYATSYTGDLAGDTGTLSILADDSTSVYLNGDLVGEAAGWKSPITLTIPTSDFANGLNTFTFNVSNSGANVTGLDFSASATPAATPEPSSFLLLGTGLLGTLGVMRKRFA